MILNLSGLSFKAHSPSSFQLLSIRGDMKISDAGAQVFVRFTGERWAIDYCAPDGHVVSRGFSSRDAAVNLIADRVSA